MYVRSEYQMKPSWDARRRPLGLDVWEISQGRETWWDVKYLTCSGSQVLSYSPRIRFRFAWSNRRNSLWGKNKNVPRPERLDKFDKLVGVCALWGLYLEEPVKGSVWKSGSSERLLTKWLLLWAPCGTYLALPAIKIYFGRVCSKTKLIFSNWI